MQTPDTGGYRVVATLRDLAGRRAIVREENGYEIALFHTSGGVRAVTNVCPHQLAPVIAEGMLDGDVVTCPMHGWSFNVSTGRAVNASGRLRTFDVRVDGEMILVRIPDEPAEPAW